MIVSFILFGIIGFTYVGYPIIVYLIAKRFSRKECKLEEVSYPSVTVLITGHNIAHLIPSKLDNLSGIQYPGDLSIMFAFDGCNDSSLELVEETKNRGYPFVLSVANSAERNGKESAIRNALQFIDSEVLVFSDADAILELDAITQLVNKLQTPGVGAVSGREIHEKEGDEGASEGQSLFYKYEEFLKRSLEKISSLCYVQGGNFAMWRRFYPSRIPSGATQDGVIAFNIVKSKYRVAYEDNAVSKEPYNLSNQNDFGRRVRTVSRAFYSVMANLNVMNPFVTGWFSFHLMFGRVLRWFSLPIACVAVVVGFFSGNKIYISALVVGLFLWGGFYYLGWYLERRKQRLKLAYFVYYFTYIHFAAGVAVFRVLMGKRTTVWKPST